LRNRKNDIPLLLDHFFELHAKNAGKLPKKVSKKALQVLIEYNWPGNIRELGNLAERLFTISKNAVINIEDISTFNMNKRGNEEMTLKEAVDAFEKQRIAEVLELVNGNKTMAAKKLGVHRNTLLAKTNKWVS
jgi:DNA-binding NtrC family response regulator